MCPLIAVEGDQAGQQDRGVKLSDQRLEGGQRAGHGMHRKDVPETEGRQGREAEMDQLGNRRLAVLRGWVEIERARLEEVDEDVEFALEDAEYDTHRDGAVDAEDGDPAAVEDPRRDGGREHEGKYRGGRRGNDMKRVGADEEMKPV